MRALLFTLLVVERWLIFDYTFDYENKIPIGQIDK